MVWEWTNKKIRIKIKKRKKKGREWGKEEFTGDPTKACEALGWGHSCVPGHVYPAPLHGTRRHTQSSGPHPDWALLRGCGGRKHTGCAHKNYRRAVGGGASKS